MTEEYRHEPVMAEEVIGLLSVVPPGVVVDATVGGGGHAGRLLEARQDLCVVGVDRDASAVEAARERLSGFGDRVQIVQGGFEALSSVVRRVSEGDVMGVLLDLGVSSPQLDRAGRGFSYFADAPLDMRMDAAQELTAATVVNEYSEERLAALLAEFGEERFADRIAARIVGTRPLRTTGDLVAAVLAAVPARFRRRGRHPARRAFQAIRMEVNRELPNLAAGLDEAVHLLAPEGRIAVLAYHSLEDRLVKERFVSWAATSEPAPPGMPVPPSPRQPLVRVLTRRALRPSAEEVRANPRASSARLRAVEKLPAGS